MMIPAALTTTRDTFDEVHMWWWFELGEGVNDCCRVSEIASNEEDQIVNVTEDVFISNALGEGG